MATSSDAAKGKRLGTVDAGPERPGGEVRPLPPIGLGLALMVATAVVCGALYGYFLSQHQPGPGWTVFFVGLAALYAETRWVPGLRERTALRRARKDARRLVKSVRKSVKKQGAWLSGDAKERLEEAARTVESTLPLPDLAAVEFASKKLDELADKHLTRKNPTREYVEQIGGAVLAALFLRAFAYEAFRIPSTSMVPTLLVGDHLFVNKFVYGLRIPFTVKKVFPQVPERGDIVVFNRPGDEHGDDIIKRVVGLPGDRVQVRDRRVTICPGGNTCRPLETHVLGEVLLNGDGDSQQVTEAGPFQKYELFQERVGEHVHGTLAMQGGWGDPGAEGEWTVKPGHVFVMGDNRDNSQDSRFGPERHGFGQVPLQHIKGRADIIWLSIGGPHGVRFDRMFSLLE